MRYKRRFKQGYEFLRTYGLSALRGRSIDLKSYQSWIAKNDPSAAETRRELCSRVEALAIQPRISILLPVYNAPVDYLRQAIESVFSQLYQNWELCIADDCSSLEDVRNLIKQYAAKDPRVRHTFRAHTGGISEATNTAASLATGEFLGFLDHDDLLRESALSEFVLEINNHPGVALLFSDEDRISPDNVRHNPYFKNDWNPELMLSHNAVCHFMVVKAAVFRELGGMRSECDGAQDWDLAIRISEHVVPDKIRHISKILYHWREIPGSTASGLGEKPYVKAAQQRVISEHLIRTGEQGFSISEYPGISMTRIRYALPLPPPTVSIVLLGWTPQEAARLLKKTEYAAVELVVLVGNDTAPHVREEYQRLASQDRRVSVLVCESSQNESNAFNQAALKATGEVLCFAKGSFAPRSSDWLTELVAHAARRDVGAVGPKIITPSGTVKSLGLRLQGTHVTGLFAGLPARHPGYFNQAVVARNVSAVSAECLAVKASTFRQVGAFDNHVERYDVDLCLKLARTGKMTVCAPSAVVSSLKAAR